MRQIIEFVAKIKIWRITLATITGTITFNVEAPLALNTPEAEVVGVASTGNVASGGQPPYTVTVTDPSQLPPGVSIGPDGTVSGTPTDAGTFNVPVSVQDSSPSQAVKRG